MKKGVDYIGVAVGAMILNDKGELFLSKRSQNTKNERGCWEIPGGGVDIGEKMTDAIKREMKEEYGIDIEIIEQFPAADHIIPLEKQHWVPTTFLAKIRSGQTPQILEPEKCDAIGWFAFDNLPEPLSIITKIDLQTYKVLKESIQHITNTLPVSVKGIVFEKNSVWLRKNERNEWELPGGKMDKDEQPEETVIRELREELGFAVEITTIVSANVYRIQDSVDESHGVLVLSYLCKFMKKIGKFETQGEAGISEFRAFSLSEINDLNMPNFYKDAIQKVWKK